MFLNRLTLMGMSVEPAKLIPVKTGRGGHLVVGRLWLPQSDYDKGNAPLAKRRHGLHVTLRIFDDLATRWVAQVRVKDIVLVDGWLRSYRKPDPVTGKLSQRESYYMRVNLWKGIWANPKKALEARGKVVLERDEFDRLLAFSEGASDWDVPRETLKDLGLKP